MKYTICTFNMYIYICISNIISYIRLYSWNSFYNNTSLKFYILSFPLKKFVVIKFIIKISNFITNMPEWPNCICVNSNIPHSDIKAVLYWSFSVTLIWLYADLRSKLENIFAPTRATSESLTRGIGYESLITFSFNFAFIVYA